MLFVEPIFFVFFAAVFAAHWIVRPNEYRKLVLLAASYLFYAAWDYRFLSLILLSTGVDYVSALRISGTSDRATKRLWLVVSVLVNLSVLGFFKYFNFFAESAAELAAVLGFELGYTELSIVLPVGISFYTFQTLSYTIDVYRGRLEARRSLLDIALFVAFFPQLVAGPIVRAVQFLPQLELPRRFREVNVRWCVWLFLIGFFKKAVLSDNIAPFVDEVFADPAVWSNGAIRTATMLYAVQIYCDFSGYSDMAIATAGLLGFRLPRNFDAPYLSLDITEFWRRWHISLSSWLRDYLYIPLGGNRHGLRKTYRNLMLTMLLGGLWHGAAWNFIIWGAIHGAALICHKEWSRFADRFAAGYRWPGPAGLLATLVTVCLAWIFFRAESLPAATRMVGAALGLGSDPGTQTLPAWTMFVLPAVMLGQFAARRYHAGSIVRGLRPVVYASVVGVAAAAALALLPLGYRPFIYFQF